MQNCVYGHGKPITKSPALGRGLGYYRSFVVCLARYRGLQTYCTPPENFGGGPPPGNSPGEVGHHWWLDVLSGEGIAATTSAKLRPPECVPMVRTSLRTNAGQHCLRDSFAHSFCVKILRDAVRETARFAVTSSVTRPQYVNTLRE